MSINTAKYLLVIVEGPSDQVTLENGLRNYIKDNFSDNNLSCDVIHGDLTVFYKSNLREKRIIPATDAKRVIGNEVKDYLNKQRLKASDILGIAQICDLDTAYGKESLEVSEDCSFSHNVSEKKTYVRTVTFHDMYAYPKISV